MTGRNTRGKDRREGGKVGRGREGGKEGRREGEGSPRSRTLKVILSLSLSFFTSTGINPQQTAIDSNTTFIISTS